MMERLHILLMAALAAAHCLAAVHSAVAQSPSYVPVQGFLADSDGTPVDNTVSIRFRLYDDEENGNVLWEETQDVTVEKGQLSVYLGDQEVLDLGIFRERSLVWVGIKVGDDNEGTPRLQLGTVPFAAHADSCGDANSIEGLSASDFMAADATIAWSSISNPPAAPDWSTLEGRPSAFPPTSHELEDHAGKLSATRLTDTMDADRLDIRLFVESKSDQSSAQASVSASCPDPTWKLISGGCNGGNPYAVHRSYPNASLTEWVCVFSRVQSTTGAAVSAFATCVH